MAKIGGFWWREERNELVLRRRRRDPRRKVSFDAIRGIIFSRKQREILLEN